MRILNLNKLFVCDHQILLKACSSSLLASLFSQILLSSLRNCSKVYRSISFNLIRRINFIVLKIYVKLLDSANQDIISDISFRVGFIPVALRSEPVSCDSTELANEESNLLKQILKSNFK